MIVGYGSVKNYYLRAVIGSLSKATKNISVPVMELKWYRKVRLILIRIKVRFLNKLRKLLNRKG